MSPGRSRTSPTSSARTARPSPGRASAAATTRPTRASARSSSRPASRRTGPARSRSTRAPPRKHALQGRRHRRRLHPRQEAHVHDQRHRVVRQRRLARLREHRRLGRARPPRRCCTAKVATTRSRSPPRRAPRPRSSCRRSSRDPARQPAGARTPPSRPRTDGREAQRRRWRSIRKVLLGFGGIALLVGAFVIFNTLSITVAQRTREFATLRTLGASRKQVMRSVKLEGAGHRPRRLGDRARCWASAIAKGMVALFGALGVELPEAGTVIASQHGSCASRSSLGTSVTLLASILPARGPLAFRRSRQSARVRPCRRRGSPRTRAQDRRRRARRVARRDLRGHVRRAASAPSRLVAAARRSACSACSWASPCWRRGS